MDVVEVNVGPSGCALVMRDADGTLPGDDLDVAEDDVAGSTRRLVAHLGAVASVAVAHVITVEDVGDWIGIARLRIEGIVAGDAEAVINGGGIRGNDVVAIAVDPIEIIQHLHVLDRHVLFILDIEGPGGRVLDGDPDNLEPIRPMTAAVCTALDDSFAIVAETIDGAPRGCRSDQDGRIGVDHASAGKGDVVDCAGDEEVLRALFGLTVLYGAAGVPGVIITV